MSEGIGEGGLENMASWEMKPESWDDTLERRVVALVGWARLEEQ